MGGIVSMGIFAHCHKKRKSVILSRIEAKRAARVNGHEISICQTSHVYGLPHRCLTV